MKTPRSSKWYAMHTDKDSASTTVCDWSPEPAKLNSPFTRVARHTSAPASRTFSQDTLMKWERAFREQSVMCNQAAGLSRCLTKVQDTMITQLKSLPLVSRARQQRKRSRQLKNLNFYCVNTSYPMDNYFTGRHDRSRQTPDKDVLYIIPEGPVSSVHSLGGASYLLPV